MLVIAVGVPACCLLFVVLAFLQPTLLMSKDWIPWVTIPAAVVMYFSTRGLRRYSRTSEIADAFRAPGTRSITMLGYFAVLALGPLLAGILVRVIRH
jgi:hypothetical protein